jgi:hypothetical protein
LPTRSDARGRTLALEAVIQQRRMTALMSDFSSFGQEQGILDVNTEVAHGVLDLGMPK